KGHQRTSLRSARRSKYSLAVPDFGLMTAMLQHTDNSRAPSPYDGGPAEGLCRRDSCNPSGEASRIRGRHITAAAGQNPTGPVSPSVNPEHSDMPTYDNDRLGSLRATLLDHPLYADVA